MGPSRAMPSFLRSRRRGELLFRRAVPKHLRERCDQGEVVRRIYSIAGRPAVIEARRLAALYDQAFQFMTDKPDLTMAEAVALARRWLRDQMTDDEQLLTEASPADRDVSHALRQLNTAKVAMMREQLASNDLSQASAIVADIERQEAVSLSPEGRERLARLILRGMVALQETYADRLQGVYRAPSDPLFAADDSVMPAAVRGEAETPTAPSPPFTEAVDKLAAEKRAAKAWDEKSEKQARDTFGLFVEHAGDRPVASYERPEMAAFRDVVLKLPRLRGKSRALTGKPLADLVAAGAEPISPKSIKRHMSIMSQAFAWMVDQGWRADNPASGVFRFKRMKAANEERASWTDAQITTLFASPIWRGRKSAKSRVAAGSVIVRDAWWWWPVIGLHTGARLGEIAQLRPDDIGEEGGIVFLDIGRSGGRRVKMSNRFQP